MSESIETSEREGTPLLRVQEETLRQCAHPDSARPGDGLHAILEARTPPVSSLEVCARISLEWVKKHSAIETLEQNVQHCLDNPDVMYSPAQMRDIIRQQRDRIDAARHFLTHGNRTWDALDALRGKFNGI